MPRAPGKPTGSETKLHPAAARVAAAVTRTDDGVFLLSEPEFLALCAEFVRPLAQAERTDIATHLLALAFKYERLDKQRTAQAIGQILVLIGLVTGSAGEAGTRDTSTTASVGARARQLVGTAVSARAKTLAGLKAPTPSGRGARKPRA